MLGIKTISKISYLTLGLFLACASNSMAGTAPLLSPPSPLMPGQSKSAASSKPDKNNKPALVLQAKVTSVDKEFEHESFKMHSVVKASVFAFKPGDDQNKIGYERFWFHDGKAIGVEKRNDLDLPAGAAIQIHVCKRRFQANRRRQQLMSLCDWCLTH